MFSVEKNFVIAVDYTSEFGFNLQSIGLIVEPLQRFSSENVAVIVGSGGQVNQVGQPNYIYFPNGSRDVRAWTNSTVGPLNDKTRELRLLDVNGDGLKDLIVGNCGSVDDRQPDTVYLQSRDNGVPQFSQENAFYLNEGIDVSRALAVTYDLITGEPLLAVLKYDAPSLLYKFSN